ncbi:Glycosyltransferase [Granulicella sibirica]|uniref:Glycosyltransferase n=2 Tax=Granulicella sibirica TaxID=2479048 RepID=A0A4Q0T423_9BACT|nr:Glycosyltransferase [Granulicella sibirica]
MTESKNIEASGNSDSLPVLGDLSIAVFHDNFAQMGGAERVAEAIYEALPGADLLSTLSAPEILSKGLQSARITNTWMNRLPNKARLFRAYFLLYPFAVDHVDLSAYDLIISSCFGYAKGVRRRAGAVHVCYCHTPMRWVWRTEDYLSREKNGYLKSLLLSLPLKWLKRWEIGAATRPDFYIANSRVVAARLKSSFGVEAEVIPPPIDTARFSPTKKTPEPEREEYYLILSRLVPYKRFDLAIQACSQTNRRLVVIGGGPDRKRLEEMAGPSVKFLGRAPDEVVTQYVQHCEALLFPGEEDFGMTPLEVNSAGRPVIAFAAGGATETIVDGLNGVFFDEASVSSLIDAMDRFEKMAWDEAAIQRHAATYDIKVFQERITEFARNALSKRSFHP